MVDPNLLPQNLRGERHFRWRVATRGRLQRHLAAVAIGLASLLLALLVPRMPALAGLVYFLMGPVMGWLGYRTGRAVERAAQTGA